MLYDKRVTVRLTGLEAAHLVHVADELGPLCVRLRETLLTELAAVEEGRQHINTAW